MTAEEIKEEITYRSFTGKLEVSQSDGTKLVLKPGDDGYLERFQAYQASRPPAPVASPKVATRRLRTAGVVAVLLGAGLRQLNWLGTDSGTYYSVKLNLMAAACASLGIVLFLFTFWKKKPHGDSWLARNAPFIAFLVIFVALSAADLYLFKSQ